MKLHSKKYLQEAKDYFTNPVQPDLEYSDQIALQLGGILLEARQVMIDEHFPEINNINIDIEALDERMDLLATELDIPEGERGVPTHEIQQQIELVNREIALIRARQQEITDQFAQYSDDLKVIFCSILADKSLYFSEAIINKALADCGIVDVARVASLNYHDTAIDGAPSSAAAAQPQDYADDLALALKLSMQFNFTEGPGLPHIPIAQAQPAQNIDIEAALRAIRDFAEIGAITDLEAATRIAELLGDN